jgi:DNA polymerase-3 subunit gamma/tau
LNCEEGPTPNPCGKCQSCIDLTPNGIGSVDVIEIDAATHGKVDNARELRESAAFVPVNSRFKIYIIDEAHELSTDAQNALLKLVEEPPEHLKFVFATTQPEKIPSTIKSRTHHYPFRLVGLDVLSEHLGEVSKKEGLPYEAAALALIATSAEGSVRDSLSLLSQLASGMPKEGLTVEFVAAQLGLTPNHLIEQTLKSLSTGDGAALFETIDSVVSAGIEPRRFAIDLLGVLRDMILLNTGLNSADSKQISTIDPAVLASISKGFSAESITAMANTVATSVAELRGAVAPRLQLELLAAKLLMLSNPVTPTPATPTTPTKPPPAGTPPAPTPTKPAATNAAAEPTPPKPKSAPAKPTSLDLATVRAHWPAIVVGLMNRRATWMIFTHAEPKSVTNSTVSIGLPDLGRTTAAQKSPHLEVLTETISTVLNQPVTVEFVHDPSMGVTDNSKSSGQRQRTNSTPDQNDATQIEETSSDAVVGVKLVEQTLGATRIAEYEDT